MIYMNLSFWETSWKNFYVTFYFFKQFFIVKFWFWNYFFVIITIFYILIASLNSCSALTFKVFKFLLSLWSHNFCYIFFSLNMITCVHSNINTILAIFYIRFEIDLLWPNLIYKIGNLYFFEYFFQAQTMPYISDLFLIHFYIHLILDCNLNSKY
jgi:hypothetical protein